MTTTFAAQTVYLRERQRGQTLPYLQRMHQSTAANNDTTRQPDHKHNQRSTNLPPTIFATTPLGSLQHLLWGGTAVNQ